MHVPFVDLCMRISTPTHTLSPPQHTHTQGGPPTIGDIFEVSVETEKGACEKLQIFDTPGSVRLFDVVNGML